MNALRSDEVLQRAGAILLIDPITTSEHSQLGVVRLRCHRLLQQFQASIGVTAALILDGPLDHVA